MWVVWLCSLAVGQDRLPDPNVVVTAAVGRPAVVSLRAEAWLADQFSAEIGFGLPDLDLEELAADLTFRFRPDVLCIGCGGRDLVTIGFGVAAVGTADADFDAWRLALGPDVAVTAVHWFTPQLGVQATLRGGAGPSLVGPDATVEAVDWWTFGGIGLSF